MDVDDVFVSTDEGTVFLSKPLEVLVQLREEFEQQDAIDDLETYIQTQPLAWILIVGSYMDSSDLKGEPGAFVWGRFDGANIGYMQLLGFSPEDKDAFFAELDMSTSQTRRR